MNFREGDVVLVEGVVGYHIPGDETVRVNLDGHHHVYTKGSLIRMASPTIVAGDTVRRKVDAHQPGIEGVVLAVALDHAWVEIGAGEFATWWIPNVERVALAGQKSEGGEA